jgi:hypothetical protein
VVVIVVFGWHGKHGSFCGIDGLAPELQVPVNKGAVVLIDYGVSNDNSPGANSRFTPVKLLDKLENDGLQNLPMNNRHECPVFKS